ncbi:MAG: L,D-transpeptidase family protein [Pseudomonadales bacterium]|nr:L,D-transpeptidase family protein [Pseudomonadales bacterium]
MRYIALLTLILAAPVFAGVDLVKVDKSERKMFLLDGEKIVREYDVAFGENPKGHKQQEGDERTPEGRYTLDYKKEDSSFYRAVHVSYPNENDKANAKETRGFSRWLYHGSWATKLVSWFAPITQIFNWTNGCIAITNSEMDEFMELVDVGTSIEIEW